MATFFLVKNISPAHLASLLELTYKHLPQHDHRRVLITLKFSQDQGATGYLNVEMSIDDVLSYPRALPEMLREKLERLQKKDRAEFARFFSRPQV